MMVAQVITLGFRTVLAAENKSTIATSALDAEFSMHPMHHKPTMDSG
jgi:hypothetical protein